MRYRSTGFEAGLYMVQTWQLPGSVFCFDVECLYNFHAYEMAHRACYCSNMCTLSDEREPALQIHKCQRLLGSRIPQLYIMHENILIRNGILMHRLHDLWTVYLCTEQITHHQSGVNRNSPCAGKETVKIHFKDQ